LSRREEDPAIRQVEAELEELGDPETGPTLPSTTLAAAAAGPAAELEADRSAVASHERRDVTREILRLSWPIMASQGMVSIGGLVDRAMVGRLGEDGGAAIPLAAVGFATQMFFLIQSALFAVGLSCVALMARAIGARDPNRAQQAFSASLQVSVGLTLALSALMWLGGRPVLEFLGAEPRVTEAALPFLYWVLGSSVLLGASLVCDSGLRANKNMKAPMWIGIAVTVVKLLLNWALIFGNAGFPRLELVGAGIATAISQAFGLVLFVVLIVRQRAGSPLHLRLGALFRPNPLGREVVRIALPGVGERIIMNLAMLSYFWVLSRYYGTLAVATYTVGVPLLSLTWIPGQAYSQACATLVGQSLGARDAVAARLTGWISALLAVGTATALGIASGWFRTPIARLFTDDLAVVAALGPFMLALAIAQPFLQLQFTLGGAHRGAGDTLTPLWAAAVGNWLFRVPLALLAAVVFEADIVWVWMALIFDHLTRSIVLGWSFRRGKWARI